MEEDYLKDLHEKYLETTSVLSKSFDVNEFKNYAKGAKKLYSHLLPKDKKTRILDIGCGQGHFLFYLLSEGFNNVTGVDISPEQVAFCKKYVTQNVFCSDYESWLKGEQYNVIVMNELLEHIPKPKIIPCLKQIYAALVGGGRVIIKVPNMRNPFNLAARYIDFTHGCSLKG
ncbi:class I SAM-dependent methyltransferase, partial [candidate division WOR-3 bacterium]|nr:class I SAM-dependent methyltransferase [candidate division WOR-3 bacterium]